MDQQLVYPLQQVLGVKKKRVDDAEREVKKRQDELRKQEEILKQKEAERDEVIAHKSAKLQQLRDEMDQGTTTDKIKQMKLYLGVVEERIEEKKKKVKEQKEQVRLAEKNVEEAKAQLALRRKEVDKLETHRKDWLAEAKKELEVIEGREQDELGSIAFITRQRRGF